MRAQMACKGISKSRAIIDIRASSSGCISNIECADFLTRIRIDFLTANLITSIAANQANAAKVYLNDTTT